MRFRSLVLGSVCLSAALLASLHASAYEKRHVFITNRGGNNIVELDDNLVFVKTWFDAEGLLSPNGMAFTPTGRLYVADTNHHRVLGFDENGAKVVEWSMASNSAPSVEALNFDKKGILYASSNAGDGRVPRFDMAGTFQSYLVNDLSYSNLGNVNFTLQGHVILSDFSAAGRGIRELDATNGNLIATFGVEMGLYQEDMFVDGTDRIFVSQFSKNEVAVFSPNRAFERSFTQAGLLNPTGIVITHDCRVLVASFNSNEIYVFKHDGTFVEKHAYPGMTLPESLAIAGQRLPGSFEDPGMEPVPKCDGTDPDGGVDPTDGGAEAGQDSGQGGSGGTALDASQDATSDQGGAAGAAGAAATGGAAGAGPGTDSGADATAGSGGAGASHGGTATGDDSGCGCRTSAPGPHVGWLALTLAGLLAHATRRRRPRHKKPGAVRSRLS
ncbi:MAG: NHL repeat-containing protein [Deltaproteobacteria bacterium]|nr:NHL repeat-containing protein [Deltaproteobacteria bacterium]